MNKKQKSFNRYTTLTIAMFLMFSIILYRLVIMQVVLADDYAQQASKNSVAELQSFAPRGNIVDSSGQILATEKQSYMLTYTETDSNKYDFVPIMKNVFKILDDNGESIKDDFELKINPIRFEFKNTDGTDEIRFKKDRGFDQVVYDKMYKKVKNKPALNNLSVEQQNKLNAELLKITPEETFNYLVEKYDLTPEGDLMNLVAYYKTNHDDALSKIMERYKPSSKENLIKLLNNYYKAKTTSDKNNIKAQISHECGADKMSYSIEEQRRLMIVKDELYLQRFSSYKPVFIADNIKKETSFIIEQKYNDIPGISVQNNPVRVYPNGELGSSFLGYISKISFDNKDKYAMKGYDTSYEYVGTAGLESAFEENLRGKTGSDIVK
ncbi:MAG: penicillin-binding protein, partial [Bacillota bacterium]|nr:penicillin-binding protein [Bacillota bacterium]